MSYSKSVKYPKDQLAKLENFFSRYKIQNVKKGSILITPHTRLTQIFYLKKGFVRLFIISPQGTELTLHIFKPPAHFPMLFSLNQRPNIYHFQAMTDVKLIAAPEKDVVNFLKSDQELLFYFSKRLFAGIEGLMVRIESIIFGNAYSRVISMLLYLAKHFGKEIDGEMVIDNKFTHQDIAMLVGISREHTSIELEKLEKQKLIIIERHKIIIPDLNRLKKEKQQNEK